MVVRDDRTADGMRAYFRYACRTEKLLKVTIARFDSVPEAVIIVLTVHDY